MVSKVGDEIKFSDRLLWGLVFAVIVAGAGGNYYFSQSSVLLRTLGGLVCVGIVLGLAYKTAFGQKVWTQWLEAVQEVRKIVWPTRQETVQTTLAVLAMVCVMGLLLWTADFVLLRAVKWLTGHWGA